MQDNFHKLWETILRDYFRCLCQNSDFAKRNVAFKVPGSPERGFVSKPVSGFGRSVSSPRSPLSASVGADSSISRTSSHSTVLKPANSPSNKVIKNRLFLLCMIILVTWTPLVRRRFMLRVPCRRITILF